DIKEARAKADVVIAFLHWGVEYSRDPTRLQRQWAHELIDNGADVVVGGHAHIVHRDEIYKGKVISYSLGNFVFSGMVKKGSRTGSVLELEVDESGVVGHGYRTITIDERGAPEWVDERTSEPVLDPPGERPLTALGKPIDFHALK
ncbi:MAG: CapA family protein, partial [Myxococcales bacterium]|nr:CapA family protein [Myxococcales bacterium]